jgi:outer membrane protein
MPLRALPAVVPLFALLAFAQAPAIRVEPAGAGFLSPIIRPYRERYVPPANLRNSGRLESLIRSGNLYLTAQDAIALAIENNIDIEIQRYGPLLGREVIRRASGGGALRNVGVGILAGPQSVSLAGINIGAVTSTGAGVSSGGGIVTQIGPTIPNLDPIVFAYASFAHNTTPLSNVLLFKTDYLINNGRVYQYGYTQQFLPGTSVQLTFTESRSSVNTPTSLLNPSISGNVDLFLTQNLLQGFGRSVNSRNIVVARNNEKVNQLQLKQQVITTVAAVLNLYWDLVSFSEDVRLKRDALAAARKLEDDNRAEARLGAVAQIDVTRAEAEVQAREQDLAISQTNLLQQEIVLKNALSRHGVEDPSIEEVHVVPLDRIEVPATQPVRSVKELVTQAIATRPDLEQTRIDIRSSMTMLAGSRNALRPTLNAFAEFTNHGLSGSPNPLNLDPAANGSPDPYYIGGYGNFLREIFRRNFPDYSIGIQLNIPLRNRVAQADYATDLLTLRQNRLQLQRGINQVGVDVRNAEIGLEQAHSRYLAAVRARELAQQAEHAEEMNYQYGKSTVFQVIQAQRDVVTAETEEVQSMANYTHARIAFDQATGTTLDTNHIEMAEAIAGKVKRSSMLPPLTGREQLQDKKLP